MMDYVAVLLKNIVILFVLLFGVQFQGCECEMYGCKFVCMQEFFRFSFGIYTRFYAQDKFSTYLWT
jgi:hypothetical protein